MDVFSHTKEALATIKMAIYGKGGIGKSTISANLSAALARRGLRVMQIGCDPKHDSTRLLMGGVQGTVLDYLRSTVPGERSLADVVGEGSGVLCVEAGGPEPGVGCAGRGIISTFELLRELGVDELGADIVLYDVLGDVVCGGFAVPLRKRYADRVVIVTSGEYMSIYAANNILRGVRNFDGDGRRVAGLVLNSRGSEEEVQRVEAFAKAVGLPILQRLPRSDLFLEAERRGVTVMQAFPGSEIASRFDSLAAMVSSSMPLHPALPLEDGEMEALVLGRRSEASPPPRATRTSTIGARGVARRYLSRSTGRREPLYGCAFAGAMNSAVQIAGALTVAHGPVSCAHIAHHSIASVGRRRLRRTGMVDRHLSWEHDVTGMGERALIFGGEEDLEALLRRRLEEGWREILVLTTCPAGIIGDDVSGVAERLQAEHPGSTIVPVLTDGNLSGDFMQGIIDMGIAAASLIDDDVVPEGRSVNVVGEKTLAGNTESNMEVIRTLLGEIGVGVNCRYLCNTSVEEVRGMGRARVSMLANHDQFALCLGDLLHREHGLRFTSSPPPVGMSATAAWMRELGEIFDVEAKESIARWEEVYRRGLEALRPKLEGRRLMVMSLVRSVDWILEAADDLGMEVVKVGVVDSPDHLKDMSVDSRWEGVEYDYSPQRWAEEVTELRPDLAVSNYVSQLDVRQDSIPLCPTMGFLSGLELGERWARMLTAPLREGWRDDGP